jgi:hypothetical protein
MKIENIIAKDEVLSELPKVWLWERIRNWRNAELKATDWTQILDSQCDKTSWADYRQNLRDLPETVSDPAEIVFPKPPTA